MKIKDTINFTDLRTKGANSFDLKSDEVVQMTTKKEILCIVRQEYLMELIQAAQSQPSLFGSLQGSALNFMPDMQVNSSPKSHTKFLRNNVSSDLVSGLNLTPTIEDRVKELEKKQIQLQDELNRLNKGKKP